MFPSSLYRELVSQGIKRTSTTHSVSKNYPRLNRYQLVVIASVLLLCLRVCTDNSPPLGYS